MSNLKSKRGSVMVWFLITIALVFTGIMQIIFLCATFPDKHFIDGSLEAAALAGASNVMDDMEAEGEETGEYFDKDKADAEAQWLVRENIRLNGLSDKVRIVEFKSKVEEDMNGEKWYKVNLTAQIKVVSLVPFVPKEITYKTEAHSVIDTQL